MTVKQQRLVRGLVAGLPASVAARQAGYQESTARSGIHALIKTSAPLRHALGRYFDRAGCTDVQVAHALKEALAGRETKFFPYRRERTTKDPESGVEITETEQVIDQREIIAHEPRLRAAELVCRIKGYLGRESADDAGDVPSPTVSITLLWPGHGVESTSPRAIEAREQPTTPARDSKQ